MLGAAMLVLEIVQPITYLKGHGSLLTFAGVSVEGLRRSAPKCAMQN